MWVFAETVPFFLRDFVLECALYLDLTKLRAPRCFFERLQRIDLQQRVSVVQVASPLLLNPHSESATSENPSQQTGSAAQQGPEVGSAVGGAGVGGDDVGGEDVGGADVGGEGVGGDGVGGDGVGGAGVGGDGVGGAGVVTSFQEYSTTSLAFPPLHV